MSVDLLFGSGSAGCPAPARPPSPPPLRRHRALSSGGRIRAASASAPAGPFAGRQTAPPAAPGDRPAQTARLCGSSAPPSGRDPERNRCRPCAPARRIFRTPLGNRAGWTGPGETGRPGADFCPAGPRSGSSRTGHCPPDSSGPAPLPWGPARCPPASNSLPAGPSAKAGTPRRTPGHTQSIWAAGCRTPPAARCPAPA